MNWGETLTIFWVLLTALLVVGAIGLCTFWLILALYIRSCDKRWGSDE